MSNHEGNKAGIRRHVFLDSGEPRERIPSGTAHAGRVSAGGEGEGEALAGTVHLQASMARQLAGTSGDDTIDAGDGDPATQDEDSEILGGQGNDLLFGGSGADTYVIAPGDGNDTIVDTGGQDTLLFTGMNQADVTLHRYDRDLAIRHGADLLMVTGHFAGDAVERIVFADGTVLDLEAAVAGIERGTANGDGIRDWAEADMPMLVQGLEGDDRLFTDTGAGRDTLDGGAGNDSLYGGAGANALLLGGEGDDSFETQWGEGTEGSLTFDGGKGNDTFHGAASADTYLYRRGDGSDVIDSYFTDQADRLELGPGILQEHVTFARQNGQLVMTVADPQDPTAQDRITFLRWFDDTEEGIDQRIGTFEFADGSILDGATLTELVSRRIGTEGTDSLTGYRDTRLVDGAGGDDTLTMMYGGTILGGAGNDNVAYNTDAASLVEGGTGNDTLDGYGAGNDNRVTVSGGKGDDFLRGGPGGETWLFARGDGNDTIGSLVGAGFAHDRVEFGAGIAAADVTVRRINSNLLLTIADPADPTRRDSIRLDNWFGTKWRSEAGFADGTSWNAAQLQALSAQVVGTDGNDTLPSYTTTLSIEAGAGNDTIEGYEGSGLLLRAGAGDDTINFVARGHTVDGGTGNDTLFASSGSQATGNTHVTGGAGDDKMTIHGGATTYLFNRGDGRDTIFDNSTPALADKVVFGPGITQRDLVLSRNEYDLVLGVADPAHPGGVGGDQLTIISSLDLSADYQIERFEFADGSALTMAQIAGLQPGGAGIDSVTFGTDKYAAFGRGGNDKQTAAAQSALLDGGDGDDTLTGGAAADFLYGGKGNDFLSTKGGADVIVYGSGDGADTVVSTNSNATLALSAATDLAGLTLAKSANNLLLSFGGGDSIVLRDWYASEAAKGIGRLQLHGGDGDPVSIYAFKALVGAFDSARATDSGLSTWAVSSHLAAAFLESSASAAYGGALAADYATQGRPEMLSAIQPTVRSQLFGVDKQAV